MLLTLPVTDAETVAALREYGDARQRNEYALLALKVGLIALRTARGVNEGDSVRREGERILLQLGERLVAHRTTLEDKLSTTLAHYFDPSSGRFSDRVERLVRDDGELAAVMRGQIELAQRSLGQTLEQFVGEDSPLLTLLTPDESNQFICAMRGSVDTVLQAEKAAILQQFSLDEPNSALTRLLREIQQKHGDLTKALGDSVAEVVAEFSLDREDSALSRLVGRVDKAHQTIGEQLSLDNRDSALSRLREEMNAHHQRQTQESTKFQAQVLEMLARLETRKEEMMRSTRHGGAFEVAVGEQLRIYCEPEGDLLENCGTESGHIPRSKVGDFVVTLSPDNVAAGARLVVEAKESQSCDQRRTLAECDEARRNRGASVCLFVHSSRTAPEGLQPLSRWGNDIVIVWDAEDQASDIVFRAGWLAAKAISVRAAKKTSEEAAGFKDVDDAIEALRKQLQRLEEIRTTSETVRNSGEKILKRAQIMAREADLQLERLTSGLGRIRTALGSGSADA
jgi:hypothetical protein